MAGEAATGGLVELRRALFAVGLSVHHNYERIRGKKKDVENRADGGVGALATYDSKS